MVCPGLMARGRGAYGCRIDDRHDESCLFSGVFWRAERFLGALTRFSGANY
jgi:hypothetical protein